MKTQTQYLKDTIIAKDKEIKRLADVIENEIRKNYKLEIRIDALLWSLVGAQSTCRNQESELIKLRNKDKLSLAI